MEYIVNVKWLFHFSIFHTYNMPWEDTEYCGNMVLPKHLSEFGDISFQEYVSKLISQLVIYCDLVYLIYVLFLALIQPCTYLSKTLEVRWRHRRCLVAYWSKGTRQRGHIQKGQITPAATNSNFDSFALTFWPEIQYDTSSGHWQRNRLWSAIIVGEKVRFTVQIKI